MARFKHQRLALVVVALGVLLVLTACGGEAEAVSLAPISELPEAIQQESPRVRDAYRFALAHPEDLANQPCYCGCGAMGHTSNLSCYIQDVAEDGSVTFDNHALGCGICVDIAQDVMRQKAEGKTAQEIRAYVDQTYSAYGPSTDTPLP